MTNIHYYIGYLPNDEDHWKFLCYKNKRVGGLVIVANLNSSNRFVGSMLSNNRYIIRDATEDDISEAIINKL